MTDADTPGGDATPPRDGDQLDARGVRDAARRAMVTLVRRGTLPPVDEPPALRVVTEIVGRAEHHRLGFMLEAAAEHSEWQVALQPWLGDLRHRRETLQIRAAMSLAYLRAQLDATAPWVVLKGPTLDERRGTRLSRDFRDLDVLVRGEDLDTVLTCLLDSGSKLLDVNWRLLWEAGSGELSVLLPTGMALDLHWHTIHERRIRAAFAVDVPGLLRRSRRRKVLGIAVPTLDPTDELAYVALHACLAGAYRLLWTVDVRAVAARPDLDVPMLRRRTADDKTAVAVRTMLEYTAAVADDGRVRHLVRTLPAGRYWARLLRIASLANDPTSTAAGRRVRGAYRGTRDTGSGSAITYVSGLLPRSPAARARQEPWRRWGWEDGNPLRRPVDDGYRARFFAMASDRAA